MTEATPSRRGGWPPLKQAQGRSDFFGTGASFHLAPLVASSARPDGTGDAQPTTRTGRMLRLSFRALVSSLVCLFLTRISTAAESLAAHDDACPAYGELSRRLSSFLAPPRVTCPRDSTHLSRTDSTNPTGWDDTGFRFLLYDVKNGEGFHLQKEVIFRVALLVSILNARSTQRARAVQQQRGDGRPFLSSPLWVLVLPPWCGLAHWRFSEEAVKRAAHDPWMKHAPWGVFFDFEQMRERVPLMEFEDFLIYQQKRLDPWGDRKMETRQQAPIAFDLVFSVRFSSTPAARRRSFCACESPASARVSRDSAETQRQDDDVCCEVNKPPASPEIRDSMPPDALQKAQVRRPKGPPAASRAKTEGQCKAGAGDGAASDVDARSEPQCLSGTGSAMEEPESEADEWNGITLWLGGFCTKIQATEMWSAQLYMSDATRVADIIWRSMETRFPGEIQTLWMKSAESLLVPWPKVLLQAHLIDMLYVHPTLREIGDLFISSFLTPKEESEADEKSSRLPHAGVETGQTPAKPAYIAAHLRRSDFIYLNRSVSLRRAAGYLVTTMKAHGVSKAFICTDGTEAEKRELRDAVAEAGAAAAVQSSSFSYNVIFFDLAAVQSLLKAGPARTSRHPPGAKAATSQDGDSARESLPDHSAMLLHPGVSALIEVWIAARAIYFIGTKDSRFSQAIRWERIMLGQTHDSSVEVFCVDNSSAEGGAATKETCMATRSHDPPEGDGRSELRRKYWP